jgi:hypothetical protein
MLFRSIALSCFLLLSASKLGVVTSTSSGDVDDADDADVEIVTIPGDAALEFVYDRDFVGDDICASTMAKTDPEVFRLWCINENSSFRKCALTCSKALHFTGSIGRNHEPSSFFNLEFSSDDGSESSALSYLSLRDFPGYVTLFAVVPLWNSHGQYFYEMLELILKKYKSSVKAIVMPLMVNEAIVVEIGENNQMNIDTPVLVPIGNDTSSSSSPAGVHILPITQVSSIMKNPFMNMLPDIEYQSGSKQFDVYIDRPVLFLVSDDGRIVQRIVIPTLTELEKIIDDYVEQEEPEL